MSWQHCSHILLLIKCLEICRVFFLSENMIYLYRYFLKHSIQWTSFWCFVVIFILFISISWSNNNYLWKRVTGIITAHILYNNEGTYLINLQIQNKVVEDKKSCILRWTAGLKQEHIFVLWLSYELICNLIFAVHWQGP